MEISSSQNSEGSLSTSYQTLILEAYGSIGEPDSVYGAGAGRLADIDSRIRTYMHEDAWDKALGKNTNNLCMGYIKGVDFKNLKYLLQHENLLEKCGRLTL